jgi:hypothetical protein
MLKFVTLFTTIIICVIAHIDVNEDVCDSRTALESSKKPQKTCNYYFSSIYDTECLSDYRTLEYNENIHPELVNVIVGQDAALTNLNSIVSERLRSKHQNEKDTRIPDSDDSKAIVILLAGDNGTGKSKSIQTIARSFYRSYTHIRDKRGWNAVLMINCYSYHPLKTYTSEEHRLSRINKLSKRLKRKVGSHIRRFPNAVVVVEEIQKMMPEVFRIQ